MNFYSFPSFSPPYFFVSRLFLVILLDGKKDKLGAIIFRITEHVFHSCGRAVKGKDESVGLTLWLNYSGFCADQL